MKKQLEKQLKQKENELQGLVQKYNQTQNQAQQVLNSIGQEIFKVQGAIGQLKELIGSKEEVKKGKK